MTVEVPNQNLSSSGETITHYTHAPTVTLKKQPGTFSIVATSFKTNKFLSEIQTNMPEEGSTAKNPKVMCISPTTHNVEQKQVQCTSNSL